MFLNDALIRQTRIKPVCLLHEASCGIAADAYAQYTGGIGVVCVTSGPGGTNAVTPCAASYMDFTPVLYISGQVPVNQMAKGEQRQGGPQEVPITQIVKPITKFALNLKKPTHINWWMRTLIMLAMKKPSGPVWLDVPLDIQSAVV